MKKVILVVEDQPEIRKLIAMTMEYGEFEVHESDNGTHALHMVRALRPHIVLLDVMMPGELDGYQVCERIKLNPEFARTPVVMLTARGQKADFELGKKAGADSYLTKPFSPLELIETVERLLT